MSEEQKKPITKVEKVPEKILAEMNQAQTELNEYNKEFFHWSVFHVITFPKPRPVDAVRVNRLCLLI